MTAEQLAAQLEQLALRLELTAEQTQARQAALSGALDEAEWELRAYLGYLDGELPEAFAPRVTALAELYVRRGDAGAAGVRARSVTEGNLSQSETYQTAEDWQRQADALLASLARFRRVSCERAAL